MKKVILLLFLVAAVSIPLVSIEPPENPDALPIISWEIAGTEFEIVYEEMSGDFTIVKIDGKFYLIYN
ncbi:MAG: hypothetical protein APR54_01450 [Candidatus Cloacimonas sp. SDB]|nr:MAG: hypothetical protein APR54_01450 [Candidatus Cloacimonas sp. SDB]